MKILKFCLRGTHFFGRILGTAVVVVSGGGLIGRIGRAMGSMGIGSTITSCATMANGTTTSKKNNFILMRSLSPEVQVSTEDVYLVRWYIKLSKILFVSMPDLVIDILKTFVQTCSLF